MKSPHSTASHRTLVDSDPDFVSPRRLLALGLLPSRPGGGPRRTGCTGHEAPTAGLPLVLRSAAGLVELPVLVVLLDVAQAAECWRLEVKPAGPGFDLARRPFGRSPGRWHLCCPACGRWVERLALVPADAGCQRWACRRCLGLPSPAQRLSHNQRALRALERAEDAELRQSGERSERWRQRLKRARTARTRAQALIDGALTDEFARAVAHLDDNST